jgi:hypothetical protein
MIARSASVCAAGWDLHSMQICKALNSDSTGMNEASIHNSYVHKKVQDPIYKIRTSEYEPSLSL